ncbi:GAD-like domain-containing protein [Butyrivibrio sp. VCB2001]|nr:GAD-like domain-containing protein [Butyrivibrio sp. VCB2001]
MLENYEKISDITVEIITKYESSLPTDLITIWKEQGFGSFMNGLR